MQKNILEMLFIINMDAILKQIKGKSDYRKFYYSAKSMESIGFILIKRGENPLF